MLLCSIRAVKVKGF